MAVLGMGLAICYRIVDHHLATMKIHSQEGVETKVEVVFNG